MKASALLRCVFLLCVLVGAQAAVAQRTGDATEIPAGFFGTYALVMEDGTAVSIYRAGTTAKLTLALDGSLCGEGIYIPNPVQSATDATRFTWQSAPNGLQFILDIDESFNDTIADGVINEKEYGFHVESYVPGKPSVPYGLFTGKVSGGIDAACDPNAAFFALAKQNYPDLFPGGVFTLVHSTSTEFSVYYGLTNTYLIINNGIASARGGEFGSTPVAFGAVKTLVAEGVQSLSIPVSVAPLSFDDYYVGTYNMTLQNVTTFSPLPSGTALKVVITKDFRLCAGETVVDTALLEDGKRVIWNNPNGGFYYQLALLPDSTRETTYQQGSLGLYSSSGRLYGTLSGTRTAESAECSDAKGTDPDLAEINLLFDLAEEKLPALFPAGPLTYNQKGDGTTFRFYKTSGITVEVKARNVVVKGGSFGTGVTAGTLEHVIAALQASTIPVQLPSSLTGTYALTFAAAGTFSPIASGTPVDLAITEEGNLCMDGTLYTNPAQDINNAALVSWRSSLTGYVIQVNTAAGTGTSVQLQIQNMKGDVLGTLGGSKTLLLAKCAGLIGGNVNIDAANELFALAEQYYPSIYPPSALTYNQLVDGSLKRYYPSTGVLLTVTGNTVRASGGVHGNGILTLGTVDGLLAKIKPTSPPANLTVSGNLQFKQGSLPSLDRKVERSDTVVMPTGTTTAELTQLVKQALAAELNGTSTFTFAIVTNTAAKLEFTVKIANTTTIAGTVIKRDYDLRFVYRRL